MTFIFSKVENLPTSLVWFTPAMSSDGSIMFIVGIDFSSNRASYLYTSRDSGSTWLPLRIDSGGNQHSQVVCDTTAQNVLYSVRGSSVLYSNDSGVTFKECVLPPNSDGVVGDINGVAIGNSKNQDSKDVNLYCTQEGSSGDFKILRSVDSGNTWVSVYTNQGRIGVIAAANGTTSKNGYVYTFASIDNLSTNNYSELISTDYGDTWVINSSYTTDLYSYYPVSINTDKTGQYVVSTFWAGTRTYNILLSKDRGATYDKIAGSRQHVDGPSNIDNDGKYIVYADGATEQSAQADIYLEDMYGNSTKLTTETRDWLTLALNTQTSTLPLIVLAGTEDSGVYIGKNI